MPVSWGRLRSTRTDRGCSGCSSWPLAPLVSGQRNAPTSGQRVVGVFQIRRYGFVGAHNMNIYAVAVRGKSDPRFKRDRA